MTTLTEAERNQFAVTLSEESDFLEALLTHEDLPHTAVSDILTRRDIVREQLTVLGFASPSDDAEQGIPLPTDEPALYAANVPDSSEEEEDGDTPHVDEDEDHEFSPNRALAPAFIRCTVCGQPEAECREEP